MSRKNSYMYVIKSIQHIRIYSGYFDIIILIFQRWDSGGDGSTEHRTASEVVQFAGGGRDRVRFGRTHQDSASLFPPLPGGVLVEF